ncbi:MAG TPA: hypothetical protein VEZ59_01600, partial [Sphingopyxis sp.]|nr:hypothetical protein [Sphingopyxis sp.]
MSIYATLTKLDREELDHIARKYPHIRADYLEFLATYGWGEVGDGNFMIYGGPVEASEIYSNNGEVGDD